MEVLSSCDREPLVPQLSVFGLFKTKNLISPGRIWDCVNILQQHSRSGINLDELSCNLNICWEFADSWLKSRRGSQQRRQSLEASRTPSPLSPREVITRDCITALALLSIPPSTSGHPSLSDLVNLALCSGDKTIIEPYAPLIWILLHSLMRCPPVTDANREHLYRYSSNPSSALSYELGKIVTWVQFSSCTNDLDQISQNADASVLFEISLTTTRCRDVSSFAIPQRVFREFIFPPYSRFQVTSISLFTTHSGRTIPKVSLLEAPATDPLLRFGESLTPSQTNATPSHMQLRVPADAEHMHPRRSFNKVWSSSSTGHDDVVLSEVLLNTSRKSSTHNQLRNSKLCAENFVLRSEVSSSLDEDVDEFSTFSEDLTVARPKQKNLTSQRSQRTPIKSSSSTSDLDVSIDKYAQLMMWLHKVVFLTVRRSEEYAIMLAVDRNIRTVEELRSALRESPDLLLRIGFDECDARDIVVAVEVEMEAVRVSENDVKTFDKPSVVAPRAPAISSVVEQSADSKSNPDISLESRYHTGCYAVSKSRGFRRWNCCLVKDKASPGCRVGNPRHHPGRREISPLESPLRRLTGLSNERWWMCCWNADRNIDGCRPGPHPDPFPL